MARINRKVRVRPQNRVTRAQMLELLLGPNGVSVFASAEQARALWAEVEQKYSPAFAARWHIAGGGDKPYVEIAARYARDVVEGRVLACRWTRLACQRHLRDLERAQSEDGWKYQFDVAKAERACRFIELLPHTKGRWAAASALMELEPWQAFIVCVLFGWVKTANGERRFSLAYIEVPRKNGKSQLAAGIGLYLFACDGEFGAEVYSGATTEKQAHEVFRPAREMILRSPELAQALGVLAASKRISKPEDGSRFEVVVGKPGDGASPHCGIVDEYHEHDADTLFDTFRTGMGARSQPLLFVITTAGDNTAGPCKLLQGDICNILEAKHGFAGRDEVFGIIYSIDAGDSWTAPESLEKSNPNLGVSVSREFLVAELQAAIINPRKQGVFQTKHQNVWVGSIRAYFDVERWKQLADPALKMAAFIGLPCVVAGDLSTKRDFTARAIVFRKRIAAKDHYYIFVRLYLPQAQVDRADAPHYKEWAATRAMRVQPGQTVDFEAIEDETVDDVKACGAREFVYDPWNAGGLAQAVEKRTRAQIVEFPQNAKFLSPAMKEFDAAIADGRIHHEGNPILEWMIGNVMAHEDANENVMPRKEAGREENKIDGAVAAIMGVGRAKYAESEKIAYRPLRSVG
jgi:phage terminase large subunit-like protein